MRVFYYPFETPLERKSSYRHDMEQEKQVSEPTLHGLDKRILSIEDWRASEADDRSNVRKQIFDRLDRHDAVLNGKDGNGGLIANMLLLTENQNELKRMTRWVIAAVFAAVAALVWTAVTGG